MKVAAEGKSWFCKFNEGSCALVSEVSAGEFVKLGVVNWCVSEKDKFLSLRDLLEELLDFFLEFGIME